MRVAAGPLWRSGGMVESRPSERSGKTDRAGKAGPLRPEGEEEIPFFLISISNPNSNQIQILLQILMKPKYHKINMHQYECTNMYVDLIFDFNFNKVFIFSKFKCSPNV